MTNLFNPFIDDGENEAEGIEDDISVRPQIKTPQIANHDKFPEICSEDCNSFRVIRGIFPSMNILKLILHPGITSNNL